MLARLSRWTLPSLIVVAALVAYRWIVIGPPQPDIVLPRTTPTVIAPRFDEPRVVTDEQLAAVLDRVRPLKGPAKTNDIVHALRLWGVAADFGDPQTPTGRELRDYLLDDATFRRFAGQQVPPLFYRGRDGVEVRHYYDQVADRDTSSYHADDLLATLGETGTPLDTPLRLRDGEARVEDLLRTSLRRFTLEAHEYEWTAIVYARYVFPQREWRNKFGEKISVEKLVDELLGHPPEVGPCDGLHRLEALVVLHRADESLHALRPRTKLNLLLALKRASQALVQAQSPEGYWARNWSQGVPPAAAASGADAAGMALRDRLLVTGHHLEWLALAPEEVQPPRETVVRAGQWLARTLLEMDEKSLQEAYGPYSHAARALCLWRNVEPFDAWRKAHAAETPAGGE